MNNTFITNEKITAKQVKLIFEGKLLGILSTKDALKRARDHGLDLVIVSETEGEDPVCQILNLDRYRFEKAKSEKEHAKRQRELAVETKEIQLRPVTGEADIRVKARQAKAFIESGNKVKLIVRFRGRERSHKDEGLKVISQFLIEIGDHIIDKPLSDNDMEIAITLGTSIKKADLRKKKIGA